MSITLREIVKQVKHLEMKLVAGEAGLDREVLWTHMVDSDTISAFYRGRNLLLRQESESVRSYRCFGLCRKYIATEPAGL